MTKYINGNENTVRHCFLFHLVWRSKETRLKEFNSYLNLPSFLLAVPPYVMMAADVPWANNL